MLNLTGMVTPGGWRITKPAEFPDDHTGGYFSDCYYVEKDGKEAFLKALDIEKFSLGEVMSLFRHFQYERELLDHCRSQKLSRVVRVEETGDLDRGNPAAPTLLQKVPYLVFERADSDIRPSLDVSQVVSNQWRFFVLHQTALALLQLHGQNIAHQDLKPSNVLKFGKDQLKLGDLGRSSMRGNPAPHDDSIQTGHRDYAPFEQRYGYAAADWTERRLGTDLFHLGCLTVFAFTNVTFPAYIMNRLPSAYGLKDWHGRYIEVLPHIQATMIEGLADLASDFPDRFRNELVEIVRDLCHADPVQRGRAGAPTVEGWHRRYLERYVARFDILEKKSRIRLPHA